MKTHTKRLLFIISFITLSTINFSWTSVFKYDFGNLKNKSYYKTLFNEAEQLKLADADNYYAKGNTKMLEAEKYFRKADGFKKVAENYGGRTLKKAKHYEKKGVKSSLKAYDSFFKASDLKFHIYSEKLKNMNSDNSKKMLKAEEIAINARSIYIDGTELKAQAEKLKGKTKVDAFKLAFDKHLEAIHNQEIAFKIYMNDPDIIYNKNTDKITDSYNTNNKQKEATYSNKDNNNLADKDIYNSDNDPNIYNSKEEFIISKLNMSQKDLSALADAKDKKIYADKIADDIDSDYEKIQKIRNIISLQKI
ncbi:MAG: hypothetical protein L3J56_07630 [Bacteroidales bacterium]|nr:hypothetical protein [Bacteroidales bacterium]